MECGDDREETEKSIRAEASRKSRDFFFRALSIAVAIWIVYTIIIAWAFWGRWASAGTFGDSFGALTSLFTCLTLAGTVYAVLMQREELELQRDEMRRGWAELKAQTAHLADQAAAMKAASEIDRLRLEAESRPRFEFPRSMKREANRISISVENVGADISDVSVLVDSPLDFGASLDRKQSWDGGRGGIIEIFNDDVNQTDEIIFTIQYTDRLDRRSSKQFKITRQSSVPREVVL